MVREYGIWKPKNVLAQLKSSVKFWSWVPMQMLIQNQNKICKEHLTSKAALFIQKKKAEPHNETM